MRVKEGEEGRSPGNVTFFRTLNLFVILEDLWLVKFRLSGGCVLS